LRKRDLLTLSLCGAVAIAFSGPPVAASSTGVGNVPQGVQTDAAYAASFQANNVTNVFATTQRTSCFRPEDPYFASLAPSDGYTGMTACPGATTGEDIGTSQYPTQVGSNPGFAGPGPMLVKNHSESDIRVDPTNSNHLIGSVKWAVSAEGYNHELGFFESFDGGATWPVQGHIPGYEGWTDNTDPVGAFDSSGNYYELILPYQFYYNSDGTHNFQINPNKEPNPVQPAEVIAVAVRPHGANTAAQWITTHNGSPDFVAPYDAKGREPDKQWIAIDTSPTSPHRGRIYAMWTVFDSFSAVPFESFADANPDGTHTDWSTPVQLPTPGSNPQGDTFLLPQIAPDGTVYTPVTNFEPEKGFCCSNIILDRSTDGGASFQFVSQVASDIGAPGLIYPNTQFRDGIEDTFVVGQQPVNGHFPLYTSWEDHSTGFGNVILTASFDNGVTWSSPIQVNDNANASVDEFQPNLAVAPGGTVSVGFYDRRLACPAQGTADAAGAGLALDTLNLNFSGALPPYGASNYCINTSIQFYSPTLSPLGHNIRISQHTWDPQLNALKPGSIGGVQAFIGDYFGNTFSGGTSISTSVSTFNDTSKPANQQNPSHFQQQVVAELAIPT
jgi:hypothetical protein